MKRTTFRACMFASVLVVLVPAGVHAQVILNSCRFEGTPARCGTVTVPEDRSGASARRLALRVVVLPSPTAGGRAPLFVVNGGPGASSVSMAQGLASWLVRRDHDIVLVDQRGTGGSNPLRCPSMSGRVLVPADVAACVSELSKVADVRQYGTDAAARDLEDVRAALGYDQINLLGISYGTRVGWWYAKTFPARLRSIVLVSPNPPSQRLLESIGPDTDHVLQLLASECRSDAVCHKAFPSVGEQLSGLGHQLVGAERLALPMLLYSVEMSRTLPAMVAEAASGFSTRLEGALKSALDVKSQISLGLHLTVQCTEEFDFSRRQENPWSAAIWDEYETACRDWPRIPIPPAFKEPFVSDARALVITGEWDPSTGPRWAAEMAKVFVNASTIVVERGTHGFSDVDACIDHVVSEFLMQRQLTTSCMTIPE